MEQPIGHGNICASEKAVHPAPSAGALRAWVEAAREKQRLLYPRGSSAVLIPVLLREDGYHVLYEVRAAKLQTQPGEICFPGGRIEPGEEPRETAVREAMEELCIRRDQVEVISELDRNAGPGGIPLFAFIGVLHGYAGTWSRAEVEYVFTLPLGWILAHPPRTYRIGLSQKFPEDFPYDKVPFGRGYHWRMPFQEVPFYPDLESAAEFANAGQEDAAGPKGSGAPEGMPVLWGATARVTHAFAQFLQLVKEK